MRSAIEDRDGGQGELVTTLAKLQAAKKLLTDKFYQLERPSSILMAPDAAVPESMKFNSRYYIQTVSEPSQAKQGGVSDERGRRYLVIAVGIDMR